MFPALYARLFLLSPPRSRALLGGKFSRTLWQPLVKIYEEALEHTQYLPREQLIKLQENRLSKVMRNAKNIPFYAEYLKNASAPEDIASLPPITKEMMRRVFDGGSCVNRRLLKEFGILRHTSGTTGVPFNFFWDMAMFPRRVAVFRRIMKWAGWDRRSPLIRLLPSNSLGLEREGTFIPCDEPKDVDKLLGDLGKLSADGNAVIFSRTSYLIRLAQRIETGNIPMRLKSAISTSEDLLPEQRAYLSKTFRAPVFNCYGTNELLGIAQECEFCDGLHVNNEWMFVEILDAHHRRVGPGETGTIVITAFDNEVMPFIRYEVGDMGSWVEGPCRCGRTLPRLRLAGRRMRGFQLPNGREGYFAPLIRPIALLVDKILQYQVIRHSISEFEIKIVPARQFGKEDKEFIKTKLREYLGTDVLVMITITDSIATPSTGKQVAFLDLQPHEKPFTAALAPRSQ